MNLILQLLFGAEVVGVTTFGFAAVGCTRMKAGVTFAANHFFTVVLHCQNAERWLNGTSSKPKYQVKCGFLLDIVIRKSAAIFQLFTGEDETLLIWWDTLFILNFGFHILNSIRSFHL